MECSQFFYTFTEKMAKPSLFFVMNTVSRVRHNTRSVLKTSQKSDTPSQYSNCQYSVTQRQPSWRRGARGECSDRDQGRCHRCK
jgi:hypothetical protein